MDETFEVPTWASGMSLKDAVDVAYSERNLLALHYADGWYNDPDNDWTGFKRVLSLKGGRMCFHIPDSFPVGDLPQIEPNWDGHSTAEKWTRVLEKRNVISKGVKDVVD